MKTVFIVTEPYDDAPIEGIFSTPMDAFEKMILNIKNGFNGFSVEEYEFNKRIDFSKDLYGKVKIDFTCSVKYGETYKSDTDFTIEFEFFEPQNALNFEKELTEKYPKSFDNIKSLSIGVFLRHRDERFRFSAWNRYKEQIP